MKFRQTKRIQCLALVFTGTFVAILLTVRRFTHKSSAQSIQWDSFRRVNTWNGEILHLYPPPWRLLNIDLTYLVNNDVCSNDRDVFILILITSFGGNIEGRRNMRTAFTEDDMARLNIRRLFLLGKIDSNRSKSTKHTSVYVKDLIEEDKLYGDVLIGDFIEDYRNLTYKHVMGLQWAGRFCPQAKYILKQDDDILVDYYQITHLLKSTRLGIQIRNSNMIYGKLLENLPALRNKDSKWYVTKEEYQLDTYPPLVSGWAYITTVKVASMLVEQASMNSYFWIDDVFLTGILRNQTSVQILDADDRFTTQKEYLECCLNDNRAFPAMSIRKSKRQYWCDFVIGPHEGNLQLMKKLIKRSKYCFTEENICTWRSFEKSLNKTCVTVKKPPELETGVGIAEPKIFLSHLKF